MIRDRDGYAILGALRRMGYNFSKVAEDIGCSDQLVGSAAHGKNNNRKVLRHMLDMGIPPEILRLPPDMQPGRENAA